MRDPSGAYLSLAEEECLARHLAKALGLPYVDLSSYRISCGILRRIPTELACRLRCVPIVWNQNRTILVVDDPYGATYLSSNPELLGPPYRRDLGFALTTRSAMDRALERCVTLVRA